MRFVCISFIFACLIDWNDHEDTRPSSPKKSESESLFFKSYFCGNPEAEADQDEARFHKSLQELKDLRSQLHFAADYCESSFLKAKRKTLVMETTKEYICRAMVTVVDHLGSVYANLEYRLHEPRLLSDTELRIHCLKQRLLTCQHYAQNLALSKLQVGGDLPRHNSHYVLLKSSDMLKSNAFPRVVSNYFVPKSTSFKYKLEKEGVPPLLRTNSRKSSIISKLLPLGNAIKKLGSDSASVVPGRNSPSVLPISPRNISFFFQDAKKLKLKSKAEERKSLGGNNKHNKGH